MRIPVHNRRGFLRAIGAATLAVALDVLPRFGVEKTESDWMALMVLLGPWRVGTIRGWKDSFIPGDWQLLGQG